MDNPFSLIVLAAQKALLEKKMPEKGLGEERLTIARATVEVHASLAKTKYRLSSYCGWGKDQ